MRHGKKQAAWGLCAFALVCMAAFTGCADADSSDGQQNNNGPKKVIDLAAIAGVTPPEFILGRREFAGSAAEGPLCYGQVSCRILERCLFAYA